MTDVMFLSVSVSLDVQLWANQDHMLEQLLVISSVAYVTVSWEKIH